MLSSIYIKRESDKKKRKKNEKECPLCVAQAFLKLDAWCESTRGLNLKEGGKEEERKV